MGRHDKAKGVYNLYEIDQILKEKNVYVEWLVLGKGPETEGLRQQWNGQRHVAFDTPPFSTCLLYSSAYAADLP